MKNYVQPADVLTLIAPTGGVVSGVGVVIGEIFAVATANADATKEFEGQITGVVQLAKTSAQAWAVGDAIYFDRTNKRADNTPVGPKIGVATEVAANPSGVGRVRLDAVSQASGGGAGGGGSAVVAEATPTPTSIATAGNETYTAAQLLSGIIVRDPAGGARTDTLPTAALLVAAIPGAEVGDTVRVLIVNGSDGGAGTEVITLAAGAGGAFDANQTAASRVIPEKASKYVHVRLTNVTAAAEAYVVYA